MSSLRYALLSCLLLLGVSAPAQQTQPTQPPSPPAPASQDPQAVNIVNQAVTAAGGAQALLTVMDYTATGNITYHSGENDIQGTVKVLGSGFNNFRLDATLPNGVRSEAISQGKITMGVNGTTRQIHSQPPMNPTRFLLPFLQLRPLVNGPKYQLAYKGLVEVNGHSAHDVQVLRFLGGITNPPDLLREYNTVDFFVDATTFQIVMMQDLIFSHGVNYSVRQIQYSNYQTMGSVSVPFTISEQLDGHQSQLIQLQNITFNLGLKDSDFDLTN